MLENTFCHVPTIGLRVERDLWACGISTWRDAIEFFMAGAGAIQIGTTNFINPHVSIEILNGIQDYLVSRRQKLADIIGCCHIGPRR